MAVDAEPRGPVNPARPPASRSAGPARTTRPARPPQTLRDRERLRRDRLRTRRQSSRTVAADFAAQRARVDRWHWRRRIRRDPRKLAFYRALVGIAGLFFICLGLITGPLPGPGGIPLVLLGLAIWASEFHWAHRLMVWFRARLNQYLGWTLRQKVLFWVTFAGCCWLLAWSYLAVFGPPGWLPQALLDVLDLLPGV